MERLMATLIEQATALLELCRRKGLRIATAKSCTGGLVAATLTEIPGSSDVVERGFVTYSNEAKQAMLGVPAATIEKFGAVSRETAEAMASGALANAPAELAVSDHRDCRPWRRFGRQAGRARAFRRRLEAREPDPSRKALRRYRPLTGAARVGGRGARDVARTRRGALTGFVSPRTSCEQSR